MKKGSGRRRKEKKEKTYIQGWKELYLRKEKTKLYPELSEDKCFSSLDSKMAVRASYIRNLTGEKKSLYGRCYSFHSPWKLKAAYELTGFLRGTQIMRSFLFLSSFLPHVFLFLSNNMKIISVSSVTFRDHRSRILSHSSHAASPSGCRVAAPSTCHHTCPPTIRKWEEARVCFWIIYLSSCSGTGTDREPGTRVLVHL